MRRFWAFVRKEIRHVLRDRKTLLLLIGMPISQIVLFGFALTNEIKNARVVVCDYANSDASRAIIRKIASGNNEIFKLVGVIHDQAEIHHWFRKENTRLAIVFPPNFDSELEQTRRAPVQLIADASDPNTAATITQYASLILADYARELGASPAPPPQINIKTRMVYNPELRGVVGFVPGLMALVLLLICAMMTSISIVREKENGTMETLLASPFSPAQVLLSKIIPYFFLSLINLTLILLLSVWALDIAIKGSVALLYAESMLFIVTGLSLGLLISNVTDSQQSAMLISLMGMMLPTMMFTGFIFPLESMPKALQAIAQIIPSRWYYIIVKDIMIKGLGFSAIWKETAILAAMTLTLFLISVKQFKVRLE